MKATPRWLTRAAGLGAVLVLLAGSATDALASGTAHASGRAAASGEAKERETKAGHDPASIGMCADARVTGVAFARNAKRTVATVKRLYSPKCRETYAYVGLREEYWAATKRNDVEIRAFWPLKEDPHHDTVDYDPPEGEDGKRFERTSSKEFWLRSSAPHSCTAVRADIQQKYPIPVTIADMDFSCRGTTLDHWWPSVSEDG